MPKSKKTTPKKTAAKPVDVRAEIQSAAEELLEKLDILSVVTVEPQEENIYKATVQAEESGLLIGFHGETLSSFQLILGLMVYKRLGSWVRVIVEVGDYRAKREEQLRGMAESYAAQAITSGQSVYLPFLPPIERRIIHIALQDRPDVETLSEGEGRNRRLVIKPKAAP